MYRVENMEKEINQFTGGEIAAKTVWVDRKGKELEMSQINDDYLFNICAFMAKGGGWNWFLTPERKEALFMEARRRFHNDKEKAVKVIIYDCESDRALEEKLGRFVEDDECYPYFSDDEC